ncbi:MAG TPA: flavodoxin-dependent (E)-4-hydroxy-3-methylbut-2-enyl-diphosphate synthase [Firmicutes bacterium]|nr:flavodoxin-dependent (E)-4-hydroxy-3-methylbut-2-enyl-diphosphate synthase [Bacillota bacterium]
MQRRHSRLVKVGDVPIGAGNPIVVQSMTSTDTRDVKGTLEQIARLKEAGCELVRVAVPDREAALAIGRIKAGTDLPLVADIHFDYRLALLCLEQGVDKLRLNPGNIGDRKRVQAVVAGARARGVPIRIGVNAGSLEKDLEEKYGRHSPVALVESALRHVAILEAEGFHDIIISLKATDVAVTLEAYKLIAQRTNYPLHVGITEAGTSWAGTIRSAVGIGSILSLGIGDTIRVSLTADPVEEVRVAYEILKALGLREWGPVLISCPTCGRCEINLMALARSVEEKLKGIKAPLKVAVMGCVVNGPGEAADADFGIAGGRGVGLLFRKGRIIKKLPQEQLVAALLQEIEAYLGRGN